MRKPHVLSLSVQNLAHFPQLPSRSKIQRWISRALENDAQITVRFVEEEEGRELNKTYRGKDYATNVLTFDYQVEPVVEADLVICVPVLEKESKDQNKTLEEHTFSSTGRCMSRAMTTWTTKKPRLWNRGKPMF